MAKSGMQAKMEGMRPSRPSLILTSAAVLGVLLLAGCVPAPTEEPTASPTASSTPTATPSATPSPVPTEEIIPFAVTCDQLLTADQVYAIDPNLALLGPVDADAGTPAAQVAAAGGTVCRWSHETSGATIDIAVAQLGAMASTALKNTLVVESNSVPTYEVEGYFAMNGANGEANAFPDPYWVSVVSPMFTEPGDALPYVSAVIGNLG